MDDAKDIAARIGQRRIAMALGIGVTAVNNAVVRGKFPAACLPVIRQICATEGITCHESAFNVRAATDGQVDALLPRKQSCAGGPSE
ncbi:hypothetical protein [Roseovarius sp. SYSU LYC5161]|uniref:hypothetical protein n=1 Tax=Roseovarius halophilus (ex Wu et al. 2025) TaxID=3376060 RepID=UPI00399C1B0A